MIDEFKGNKYLGYIVIGCEQGSEGWSSFGYICVAQGNTKEDVAQNYLDNVKLLFGVDFQNDFHYENGEPYVWYHELKFAPITESFYGNVKAIDLTYDVEKHAF